MFYQLKIWLGILLQYSFVLHDGVALFRMVLLRSPSDRKQIDLIAERIFSKDRPNFMNVYGSVSAKPYGYILIDNQPKTTSDKQVVSDVFGHCQSYPHITTGTHLASEVT